MSERSFIFNADSASGGVGTINEADWQNMLRRFLATGVITGSLNQLAVTADGSGMSVSLDTGDGFVEGFFYRNDAALAKTIAAANATNPRIDTGVLRMDRVANSVVSAVVTGTAAVSPVPPTLTQTDSLYELPLADVRVPAAAGVIVAADVTDRRVFSKNLSERDANAAYDVSRVILGAGQLEANGGAPVIVGAGSWPVWAMDSATTEIVGGLRDVPNHWTTYSVSIYWTNLGTGAGNVQWAALHAAMGDGDTLTRSLTEAAFVAPAQNVVKKTTLVASQAAGSDGALQLFSVLRSGAHANDTLANDAGLLAIVLEKVT